MLEPTVALGVGEPSNPFGRGREPHAMAGKAGADTERDRQVRLAGARRAQRDDALLGVQEVELPEVLDHLLAHGALEAEVELLQGLARREARLADACRAAVAVARRYLGFQQCLHEPLIAPLLLAGAVGELRQRPGCGR